jgi:formamidopyrimidine-DNA glycosylase
LFRERLAPETAPVEFCSRLSGARFRFVHRRGKHILFDLDNLLTLIVHLRMSGRFVLLDSNAVDPKFTHAAFDLDDGRRLVFQDQRHFGMMKVVRSDELYNARELRNLAPEPFSDDFTAEYFHGTLKRSNRSIKEFLIDQTKVCGLGNIYASEALFKAGIRPSKRTNSMSLPRARVLHEKIRETLTEALDSFTLPATLDSSGEVGYYGERAASYWNVYEREGMPCITCGTPIRRVRQGGRSTYFCPVCQKR